MGSSKPITFLSSEPWGGQKNEDISRGELQGGLQRENAWGQTGGKGRRRLDLNEGKRGGKKSQKKNLTKHNHAAVPRGKRKGPLDQKQENLEPNKGKTVGGGDSTVGNNTGRDFKRKALTTNHYNTVKSHALDRGISDVP